MENNYNTEEIPKPNLESKISKLRNWFSHPINATSCITAFLIVVVATIMLRSNHSNNIPLDESSLPDKFEADISVKVDTVKNEPTIKPVEEKVYSSPGYTVEWDSLSRKVKTTHEGSDAFEFSLPSKPLHIVLHKPTNQLAVITSTQNKPNKDHILYLINNSESNLVFEPGSFDYNINPDDIMYYHLYYYWNEDPQQTLLQFSPNGNYLFNEVLGWESSDPIIVDTKHAKVIHNGIPNEFVRTKILHLSKMFFSPFDDCWINIMEVGRWGQSIDVGNGASFVSLELPQEESAGYSLYDTSTSSVLWQPNCAGVVYYESYDRPIQIGFNYPQTTFKPLTNKELPTNLHQSTIPEQEVIYSIQLN